MFKPHRGRRNIVRCLEDDPEMGSGVGSWDVGWGFTTPLELAGGVGLGPLKPQRSQAIESFGSNALAS